MPREVGDVEALAVTEAVVVGSEAVAADSEVIVEEVADVVVEDLVIAVEDGEDSVIVVVVVHLEAVVVPGKP